MPTDPQRHLRVPLVADVQSRNHAWSGNLRAGNISDTGLFVRAKGVSPADVKVGDRLDLVLSLPDGGPDVELSTDVMWVDAGVDAAGESKLGLGLRFGALDAEVKEHIRQFIESFAYRVVVLGFQPMQLARHAFGDLYQLVTVETEAELSLAMRQGPVGALLIGEHDSVSDPVARLRRVCDSRPSPQPPILYCARNPSPALASLLASDERVSYVQAPLERLELRGLVQRSVQSVTLNFENQLLNGELRRAIERLRQENQYLRASLQDTKPSQPLAGMVGQSAAMRSVYNLVAQVAPVSTSVLILGETGTGKELVARAIHQLSPRSNRAFVTQNCAALVESLLDSELFGHARGSYTGATHERPGMFEAADGGTVFLDEVGDMSQAMQAKLLRVLQNGELKRVGENRVRRVDVRLISATHRDLDALVKEGRFREDLYYRLRTLVVRIPALRDRPEDIALLVLHFLEHFAKAHGRKVKGVTRAAMQSLETQPWPGNVRQLQHTIELLVVLAGEQSKIDLSLVQQSLSANSDTQTEEPSRGLQTSLDSYERRLILDALERTGGVVARAARLLGVERSALSKRCKRLQIKTSTARKP